MVGEASRDKGIRNQTFLQHQAVSGVVSVALLLFFSSMAFRMLEEAVAGIFVDSHVGVTRRWWLSALLPFVFILPLMIALLGLTLATTGLDALGDRSVRVLGFVLSLAYGVKLMLRLAGFVGLVLLFAALYRFLPVLRISTKRALIGGLCAAVLWRAAGFVMIYYFTNISMVNLVYGSLATVVVLLLGLEVAFMILLFGAQVIAELEGSARAGVAWYRMPPSRP